MTKRTLRGTNLKKVRTSGFRQRMASKTNKSKGASPFRNVLKKSSGNTRVSTGENEIFIEFRGQKRIF